MKNFLEILSNNYLPVFAQAKQKFNYPAIYDKLNKKLYVFYNTDIMEYNKNEIYELFTLLNLDGIELDLRNIQIK